jgi:hypothetical protein
MYLLNGYTIEKVQLIGSLHTRASRIVLYYLALKSFGFEVHDECYSRYVGTKFDNYVFITVIGSIPLLVD